jgi:hypothetical protein
MILNVCIIDSNAVNTNETQTKRQNMKPYSLYSTLILFAFGAAFCDRANADFKHVVKREYHNNGNTNAHRIIEQEFLEVGAYVANDGEQIKKYYLPDGKKSTTTEGGQVLLLEYFRLGKQDSVSLWYDFDGSVSYRNYFLDGRPIGSHYSNLNEKGSIDRYWLIDRDSIVFTVVYPKIKSGPKVYGTPVYPIGDNELRKYFPHTKDEAVFLIANPEKLRAELSVEYLGQDKIVHKSVLTPKFFSRINTNYVAVPIRNIDRLILFVNLVGGTTKQSIKKYRIEFQKADLLKLID